MIDNITLGKVYYRYSALIEIDHDSNTTKIVQYSMYPAKENDWLLKRKKKQEKKPDLVKDNIEDLQDVEQEVLF